MFPTITKTRSQSGVSGVFGVPDLPNKEIWSAENLGLVWSRSGVARSVTVVDDMLKAL